MTDLDKILQSSAAFHKHARGCKKPLDDCPTCKASIDFHRALSLALLSRVLEDKPRSAAV